MIKTIYKIIRRTRHFLPNINLSRKSDQNSGNGIGKLTARVTKQLLHTANNFRSMEVQSYICQLPEEILCYIASFLSPKDVTRLSMTCCQMRRILPTFIVIHGPGINQIGPSDGHWTPEFYFNAPKLTSRLKTVTISMSWHDQVKSIDRKYLKIRI